MNRTNSNLKYNMGGKIIFLFIFFCQTFLCFGQLKELNTSEKLADFDSLYYTLKQNYMYFEVNKRTHNIDWLANYEIYQKQIRLSKNNKEFYIIICQILSDLNNWHTDLSAIYEYDMFLDIYEKASKTFPEIISFVNELKKNNESDKVKYWKKIIYEIESEKKDTVTQVNSIENNTTKNLEISYVQNKSLAILKIHSFWDDQIERDKDTLKLFFQKLDGFKNLIIDVQGNEGGNTQYWSENIVPYLIKQKIIYKTIIAFKNTGFMHKFKPDYFENSTIEKPKLKNLPKELFNNNVIFKTIFDTIHVSINSINYKGKIFLLVDNDVFSSAEAFTVFCKQTKFANVVGIQTAGDGIGSDPVLYTLPNSGLIVRFTAEMGLNSDGSANVEMKTCPDIILKSNTKNDRLMEIISLINKN